MKILRLKSGYNTDKEEVLFRNPKDNCNDRKLEE